MKSLYEILLQVVFQNDLGIEEGTLLSRPIVEFYYKDDCLGDPLLTEEHIEYLEIATEEEANEIKRKALKVKKYYWDFCRSRCSVN